MDGCTHEEHVVIEALDFVFVAIDAPQELFKHLPHSMHRNLRLAALS
jgi:hypothetical protein